MESKFSLTQQGNLTALAGLIAMIAHHYRWALAEAEIFAVLSGLVTAIGIMVSWYGRWRKGDLKILGGRK